MNLEEIQIDNIEITDEQLQSLYMYLSMTFDTMDEEQQKFWNYVMEKIDPEYD